MAKRSRGGETHEKHQLPSEEDTAVPCSKRAKDGRKEGDDGKVVGSEEVMRWRRQLWLCAIGYEDLLRGWFPFVDEDFCWDYGSAWEDTCLGFDDIWQIKNITEVPK